MNIIAGTNSEGWKGDEEYSKCSSCLHWDASTPIDDQTEKWYKEGYGVCAKYPSRLKFSMDFGSEIDKPDFILSHGGDTCNQYENSIEYISYDFVAKTIRELQNTSTLLYKELAKTCECKSKPLTEARTTIDKIIEELYAKINVIK